MKLENQVCSLDLAKRLKELGVKQESYAYWLDRPNLTPVVLASFESGAWNSTHVGKEQLSKIASAFTVAELGEMLPEYFESYRPKNVIGYRWSCYDSKNKQTIDYQTLRETEADARAAMLIYLHENNLMTL